MAEQSSPRAPRNRTITLTGAEQKRYAQRLFTASAPVEPEAVRNRIILGDIFEVLDYLPPASVDLLFADPPYNMAKSFNRRAFTPLPAAEYEDWLDLWIAKLPRLLKPTASVYICGDWRSSTAIHRVLEKYFMVRNRITWEREKGRGASGNWKNSSEDIWFCTVSDVYVFNVEAVKLKRRVIAPYTDVGGAPKDWAETSGGRYRLTHPSNLWTDLTVPFWSMPENTDHPTQKPEKLLAKVILASSNPADLVFDPFAGSGTTAVTAKKLGRHYLGVEIDPLYGCLAEKRLDLAEQDNRIQGYCDGVFWERNTLSEQPRR